MRGMNLKEMYFTIQREVEEKNIEELLRDLCIIDKKLKPIDKKERPYVYAYAMLRKSFLITCLIKRISSLTYKFGKGVVEELYNIFDCNKEKMFLLLGKIKDKEVLLEKIVIINESGTKWSVSDSNEKIEKLVKKNREYLIILTHTHIKEEKDPSLIDRITTQKLIDRFLAQKVLFIGGIVYKNGEYLHLSLYSQGTLKDIRIEY